ncbi:hypothetical protein J1614_006771 [Plenodomus biglobosus]|nr:hypothetical protein J1614_006771 [Plenodomus biglobosus]
MVAQHHSCPTPPALERLTPPISKNDPRKTSDFVTPASITAVSDLPFPAILFRRDTLLRPDDSPDISLGLDLNTPRLDDIHQHLWLAGLPNAARPLHRQKLLGRNVLLTEDPDEHLVWFETQLFIKPLPHYLFDYDYWSKHLCSDKNLHQAACGLLLSYAWLVCYKSDLNIAKDNGLLPKDIEWHDWIKFLNTFLDNIDLISLSNVSKRYKYGELRLSRLNTIYRVMPPAYSLKNLIRGYRAGSTWYTEFFGRHFKWMLAVFAVLSVSLSALQVGLATLTLQKNGVFQTASYGFTVASVVAVIASVVLVFFIWLGLFWYHLLSTWRNDRAVNQRRLAGSSSC